MSSSILASRAPQCSSCVRRLAASFGDAVFAPTRQQTARGKKTVAKVSTVNVRLLQDVKRYGQQGSILRVAAGRMRNDWYPNRMAEYVTLKQLRETGVEDAVKERDSTFGVEEHQVQQTSTPEEYFEEEDEEAISVDMALLSPERSLKLMDMILPANLDFYRAPVATPTPAPVRISPSIPISSSVSAAAAAAASKVKISPEASQKTSIYGSVSTADIAANLKAVLAEDEEGSRVVVSAEDIKFVNAEGEGEERHRVKHLGIFEIDISVKGGTDVVRRTIKVNAQE